MTKQGAGFTTEVDLLQKDFAGGHITWEEPPIRYAALVKRVFSKYWGQLTMNREPRTNGYEFVTSLYARRPGPEVTPWCYIVATMDEWTGTFRLFSSKDTTTPLKEFTYPLRPDAEGDPWTHIGALLSYTRTRLDEALEADPG